MKFITTKSLDAAMKSMLLGPAMVGLTLGMLLRVSAPAYAEEPAPRPNIIYILADDMGYGDLGCYGQKLIQTPHIDRLAQEGMRFTDHYAGSSSCAPSRCVLITGLHTGHSYIRSNRSLDNEGNVPIPADSQTIGKLMKQAGYATAAMGKWGLGYPGSYGDPNNQGFDLFFGYNCQREAHNYYPDYLWRNQTKVMLEGNANGQKTQYSHDLLTEEALGFIRTHKDRPFFLYLPYTIPHLKHQVPALGIYADKPWTDSQKCQAAMISRLDSDVGRIVALLKELELDEQTIVFFSSDNGPHGSDGTFKHFNASGELRDKKRSLYEGGIRVPMICRWPGHVGANSTTDLVSGFQDMLPTFGELAGVQPKQPFDGISLLPTLTSQGGQQPREYMYWEKEGSFAVRMGKWKAVVGKSEGAQLELYNLDQDIGETTDIAAENPQIVAQIKKIMEQSHTPCPSTGWVDPRPSAKRGSKKRGNKNEN